MSASVPDGPLSDNNASPSSVVLISPPPINVSELKLVIFVRTGIV
ncbi:MAG: hypothetical protein V1910_00910 [bacterium]